MFIQCGCFSYSDSIRCAASSHLGASTLPLSFVHSTGFQSFTELISKFHCIIKTVNGLASPYLSYILIFKVKQGFEVIQPTFVKSLEVMEQMLCTDSGISFLQIYALSLTQAFLNPNLKPIFLEWLLLPFNTVVEYFTPVFYVSFIWFYYMYSSFKVIFLILL